ncbi:MAG: SDR family NAD(P)-dependent oxidoreductase [Paracoccaceae bacterium]
MVGQACRLPGANSIGAFRSLLRGGVCAVTSVPQDRWKHDLFLHPKPGTQGKSYTFAAGVLDDVWGFDLSVFNLSPREVSLLDPQQRLMMQVVFEALEDAHIAPESLSGQRVGVFVGASSMDHGAILGRDPALADAYLMTGNTLSLVANRISHAFDLRGPSFVVDTACSSSLVALDTARKALESGDIDTAIVGGVNLLLNPGSFIGFSAAQMLSPTGLCQTFSSAADGYVRSEGCVAVVLKRSSDVPRRARARIVESHVNADGATMNVALPAEEGQYALLSELYDRAQIDPDALSFIEAHGTGTLVGDPIEAHALSRALAKRRSAPLPIGSSKTNVGHLEPASGLVGLLKTLVAFEDRRLPASLHAANLNPNIDFEALNLSLAQQALDLPENQPLLAGISSFGFGGVNAHCIVQSVDTAQEIAGPIRQNRLVVTSAFCEAALKDLAQSYAETLQTEGAFSDGGLVDQIWAGRGHHPRRLAVLAKDATSASEALLAFKNGQADKRIIQIEGRHRGAAPVFVFSGNGAQYDGMCRLALETDPVYRARFAEIDAHFAQIVGWSLLAHLEGEALDVSSGDLAQGLLFADQVSQVASLAERGLKPAAVMGHSGGEIAAACASGALSLEQAIGLIAVRCGIQRHIEGKGGMAALQVGAAEAEAALARFDHANPDFPIAISAINSPRSVTLSGPKSELQRFGKWVKKAHRFACVQLDLDFPYHSVLLAPYEADFHSAMGRFEPQKSDVRYISCTHGHAVSGGDLNAHYWWDNLRFPVVFHQAVQCAVAEGYECFLEIGASPVLTNYLRDSAQDGPGTGTSDFAITHTLSKADPEGINPLDCAFARAVLVGCAFDEGRHFSPPKGPEIDLPEYPWQNTPLRATDSPEIHRQMGTGGTFHTLLGARGPSQNGLWLRDWDAQVLPAFADHKVGDAVLLPATAMAEMAFAAAHLASGGGPVEITDFDLSAPVTLSGPQGLEIQTTADIATGQIALLSRARLSQNPQRAHMKARFCVLSSAPPAPLDAAPLPISQSENRGLQLYQTAHRLGLNYGPAFQGVSAIRIEGDIVEVALAQGIGIGNDAPPTGFDPVQMDCLLHGLIEAAVGSKFDRTGRGLVPIRIARLQVFAPGAALCSGRLHIRRWGESSILVDVTGFGSGGEPVVLFEGLRLQATYLRAPIEFDQHLFHVTARPILPHGATPEINAFPSAMARALPAAEAEDDSGLLISAATHQAIWRAMRERADAAGLYTLKSPDLPAEHRFLAMLEAFDLAQQGEAPGAWQIAQHCELPSSDDIAHSLLAERPDLIADLSILLHLPQALSEILTAKTEFAPEPEALFGQEALKGLGEIHPGALKVISAALKCFSDAAEKESRVRIGVIGQNLSVLTNLALANTDVEFVEIRSKSSSAPSVHADFASLAWEEACGFDAIVIPDAKELETGEFAAWLNRALRAGGGLFILNQNAPALAAAAFSTAIAPRRQALSTGRIEQCLAEISALEIQSFPLADGANGGALCIGILPQVEPEPALDLQSDQPVWPVVWQALYGPCQATIDGFERIEPAEETAPLLLIRRPQSDVSLNESLLSLKAHVLGAAKARRPVCVVLPKGAQFAGAAPADPHQYALWCSLRSIANEYPDLKLTTIDPCEALSATQLLTRLRDVENAAPNEREIVIGAESVLGLRVEIGLPEAPDATVNGDTALTLKIQNSRRLNGLKWIPESRGPLLETEVEIEISATGLNYRDVMWAMGLLPEEALETGFVGPTLGLECAGRIVRLGSKVTNVALGDLVIAFGPASFSTHLVIDENWVSPAPNALDPAQAATLPVAYFTAQYALGYLGRLEADETVLIHGGAGGVGLAAIALAQSVGARVIATAGSPVKQKFLKELGVDHVLSSRDTDFSAAVRKITDGQGVDIVLNSLAGPAMEASLALLRPYGRFLELGKQDYYSNTSVGLRALKNNISYFGVDIDSLLVDRPEVSKKVLADVMSRVKDGQYAPLPMTVFDADNAPEAFRLMQRSGQIGKIVITPPDAGMHAKTGPIEGAIFRPNSDGWHVIAGGLGGLGLEWAEILQRRGAQHLALLSRSGTPSEAILKRLEDMRRAGADVRILRCDITDKAALEASLNDLRAQAPVVGIYHAAMVLEDRLLKDVEAGLLAQVLPVKTSGTDNLDQATRSDDLQAFVVFTSLATLIGNVGQTAYVAANAYQEAVIKQRVADGFPGLAVGFGAITDAGYVARDEGLSKMLEQLSGKVSFPACVALNALCRLLALPQSEPCVTITPMRWGAAVAQLKLLGSPSYDVFQRLARLSTQGQSTGTLRADILELTTAKAIKSATRFLKLEIAGILRVSESALSTTRPLAEYGMDSLMGVELGMAVQEALGDDLPMPSLADGPTIASMATAFVEHIKKTADPAQPSGHSTGQSAQTPPASPLLPGPATSSKPSQIAEALK